MSPLPNRAEVAVIGGGPAGATSARLLAEWGHEVVLLCRPPGGVVSPLAESLPPSTRKTLAAVGALAIVESAGFLPSRGNTSWWGSREARVEGFAGGACGFQVLRADLQEKLLAAAAGSGAGVHRAARVRRVQLGESDGPEVELEAEGGRGALRVRHVLDASGRVGVLARHGFRRDQGPPTLALCAAWSRGRAFDLPDDSHTLVESFAEGWAFSVPVAPGLRHVAVMVDPPPRGRHPRDLRELYARALASTRQMRTLVGDAELVGSPWALEASSYSATAFAGETWALVGDAGSFLDPLSSFGVKKALASGWLAAVAAHTALVDPSRAGLAAEFFARREAQAHARYAHETSLHAARAGAGHPGSAFWARRVTASEPPSGDDAPLASDEAVRNAFADLRARPRVQLRLGPGVRFGRAPCVRDQEITLADALLAGDGRVVHFVSGVEAETLARLAPSFAQVGEICEAYSRVAPPAATGALLHGLATLLAAGLLTDDSSPAGAR